MGNQKKIVILLCIISIYLILIGGCTALVTPEDYDSYTVSYIKVSPSSATMQVNASKLLKVKAYDSEGQSIPIDPSDIRWGASYECLACGVVWKFNPKTGSDSTYFTPERIGRYYVYAHYKENTEFSCTASSRIDVE
jgi:hypothetical protein